MCVRCNTETQEGGSFAVEINGSTKQPKNTQYLSRKQLLEQRNVELVYTISKYLCKNLANSLNILVQISSLLYTEQVKNSEKRLENGNPKINEK